MSNYNIGDVVCHKTETQAKYIVIGFNIIAADDAGNVIAYDVICSMPDGSRASFNTKEIEATGEIEHG
jgi:hypothetical protein